MYCHDSPLRTPLDTHWLRSYCQSRVISKSIIVWCLAAIPVNAGAKDHLHPCNDNHSTWEVVEENDVAGLGTGSDEFYTQGLLIAHHYHSDCEPDWTHLLTNKTEQLFSLDPSFYNRQVSLKIGQNMFTPGRIDQKTLTENDRPYAAWLYLGETITYQSRLIPLKSREQHEQSLSHPANWFRQDQHFFDLQIGWVGPAAGGEFVQREFHKLINTDKPLGWDNQIPFEPGIFAHYRRAWRFGLANRNFDVTPTLGIAIGNIQTYASLGGTMRAGINITSPGHSPIDPTVIGFHSKPQESPQVIDIGHTNTRKDHECWILSECYLLNGFESRAIAHNIFLDGTTLHNSHSVNKESLVHDLMWGFRARWSSFQFDYTFVRRSREFNPVSASADEQDGHHDFGSVSFRWSI